MKIIFAILIWVITMNYAIGTSSSRVFSGYLRITPDGTARNDGYGWINNANIGSRDRSPTNTVMSL